MGKQNKVKKKQQQKKTTKKPQKTTTNLKLLEDIKNKSSFGNTILRHSGWVKRQTIGERTILQGS